MADRILGIYGAGGLGREVLELAKIIDSRSKRWSDIVFIVDGVVSNQVNGIEVLEYEDAKKRYGDLLEIIVGIGEPAVREKKYKQIELDGVKIPTLIHPDVYVPETVEIGRGVVIQMGCFISSNITIENYVYIQPHCNVGHDDVLKEGCILSGFVNLGGNITIGSYTYIGLSSAIKEKITIGNNCIIGMGSIVFKDVEDEMIVLGNPARPLVRNIDRKVFK